MAPQFAQQPAAPARPTDSSLPATQPTIPTPTPAATVPTFVAPKTPTHRARVTFLAGQLTIVADNSSLNQILREISRTTGMTIAGGVSEDRVYGTYGPADTGTVLSELLTGSGTNFLLRESSPSAPRELVLTTRQGGATLPTPASMHSEDDDRDLADIPPQQTVPTTPRPQATPAAPALAAQPGIPSTAPSVPSTQTVANPTTDQSPNGVKTPQQIYDQLMKMQQKSAAQSPAAPH